MGREAVCTCRHNGVIVHVKALLESSEIILRGELKRRIAFTALTHVRSDGAELCFESSGERFALALGDNVAASWARKLLEPPPSLAKKLGVGPSCKAFVFGSIDEPALSAALHGAQAEELLDAGMIVAVTPDAASLEAALLDHERCAIDIPIWIVHGKGPRAGFGEAAVREAMRKRGYSDTKVSAVSDTQSATRYARRRGAI